MSKTTSSKTKTRRPTTKRSSLSSTPKAGDSKKATAKPEAAKKATPKSVATKKVMTKKPAAKPASRRKSVTKKTTVNKPVTRKAAARKPSSRKPRAKQKQLVSLPLGRFGRLSLQISQPVSNKRKASTAAQKKVTKRRETGKAVAIIMIGLSASLFFGLRVLAAPSAPPIVKSTPVPVVIKKPEEKFMPASTPTHLRIPDIAVDTTLSQVDLAPDGSIAVPSPYLTAGWYKRSPTPGQQGPSIIVGHLDNIRGLAVFWRLRELTPGQQIQVERQDGTTVTFKVDKVEQFNPDTYPTAEVYGNLNYAGLRLITCGGTFNRLTHGYDANTVVFASQVQPVL